MRKNKKKSRISEADKLRARGTSRAAIRIIQDELKSCALRLGDVMGLLEFVYPEDEIEHGNTRPSEYTAAASLKDRIMRAIRHTDNLLNK